jgi:hypothetical protein
LYNCSGAFQQQYWHSVIVFALVALAALKREIFVQAMLNNYSSSGAKALVAEAAYQERPV